MPNQSFVKYVPEALIPTPLALKMFDRNLIQSTPMASCQRKSSRPPYKNLGVGAGVGEASELALAADGAAAGGNVRFAGAASKLLDNGWTSVSGSDDDAENCAAALRFAGGLSGISYCPLATQAVPSSTLATRICLFMILPSEVRPHAWNRPLCYGKQDRGALSTFFRAFVRLNDRPRTASAR